MCRTLSLDFFDGMRDEQRSGADERAQRVADHVIHLRHAESITVLGVLNPRAEDKADERCDDDSAPAVPLPQQRIGQRQPQREEKKDVHQHLTVEFRLLLRGGDGSEGSEDEFIIAGRASQDSDVEDNQCSDKT